MTAALTTTVLLGVAIISVVWCRPATVPTACQIIYERVCSLSADGNGSDVCQLIECPKLQAKTDPGAQCPTDCRVIDGGCTPERCRSVLNGSVDVPSSTPDINPLAAPSTIKLQPASSANTPAAIKTSTDATYDATLVSSEDVTSGVQPKTGDWETNTIQKELTTPPEDSAQDTQDDEVAQDTQDDELAQDTQDDESAAEEQDKKTEEEDDLWGRPWWYWLIGGILIMLLVLLLGFFVCLCLGLMRQRQEKNEKSGKKEERPPPKREAPPAVKQQRRAAAPAEPAYSPTRIIIIQEQPIVQCHVHDYNTEFADHDTPPFYYTDGAGGSRTSLEVVNTDVLPNEIDEEEERGVVLRPPLRSRSSIATASRVPPSSHRPMRRRSSSNVGNRLSYY